MNKQQVGKILDDEALLIESYERQGLTTSDAQSAAGVVMVQKYGVDSFAALNELERDEAKTLLIEREATI